MATLAQLTQTESYRACDWDLRRAAAGRAYWTALFRWHLDEVLLPTIKEEYSAATAEQVATFAADYRAEFDRIDAEPEAYERLDVLFFTERRRGLCARYGFHDPFGRIKQRENEAALALLPGVLAELDAAAPPEQHRLLVLGLMAGNIFDLGSRATSTRRCDGAATFRKTRAAQPPRPWLYDNVDAWWQRWASSTAGQPAYRHVVFFLDNAGGDVLLGCLPLARGMIAAGTRITLAANSGPALNDITAADLEPLLQRSAALDPPLARALRDGLLRVVATGSSAPLLDLTDLSAEFVMASCDADLVMLHGMGRAIESNFHATFSCDVLRTAVLKDEAVAGRLGGKVFACVFRFESPARGH